MWKIGPFFYYVSNLNNMWNNETPMNGSIVSGDNLVKYIGVPNHLKVPLVHLLKMDIIYHDLNV